MIKFGVLLSGSGTNLQALIDAIAVGALEAEIALVLASKPDAYGLVRAREAGIPTQAMNREDYQDRIAADTTIARQLKEAGVDYVVMAGYMRMINHPILDAFPDRVINLHPSLLPAFKGAQGIKEAFDAGVKVTGVTVHFANEEYDKGPIIAQRVVAIEENDTLESLEEKIHVLEHEMLPSVLQLIAAGRVSLDSSRKVRIT